MKLAFAFAYVLAFLAAAASSSGYTTKYDDLNIDAILANRRLVDNYVKCILEKGRCNEEGNTLKEVIPDAIITDCAKCSQKQRVGIEKIIRFLVKNRRKDFDELSKKYDPMGIYKNEYRKYLE